MDTLVSVLLVALGVVIIFATLASTFRTVVLPRAAFDPITRVVFLSLRRLLLWVSRLSTKHLEPEMVLAVHAPLSLLTLALAWAIGVIFGFTLLFLATGTVSLEEALILSGSSFTTLGFIAPSGFGHQSLVVFEAILGLLVVALLIAYLPTIYGLFSRREVVVSDVSIKCGGVASGPRLLTRLSKGADTTRLDDSWLGWEHWFIAVHETHTTEPALNFFRSPQPDRSWLTMSVAVLDAALLRNVVVDAPESARAEMMYRAGVEAIAGIGSFFGVSADAEAAVPSAPDLAEFERAIDQLAAAGIPTVSDRDSAWQQFTSLRTAYASFLPDLRRTILPPDAPWMPDSADTR